MINVRRGTGPDAWTIGSWSEIEDSESRLRFRDRGSAALWLRGLRSYELRQIVRHHDEGGAYLQVSDAKLVERVAAMLVSGELRVCPVGAEDDEDDDAADALSAESRLVRRLRITANEFSFEGDRLRIIRAGQWSSLRRRNLGRYQVVPQTDARKLLAKMSAWPAISRDEKAAIEEAVPLVPDLRRVESPKGILVLRIVPRSSSLETASQVAAITPSQLARQQPTVEVHWIEIELLDENGAPVANEPYRLELPDGTIQTGKLDSEGRAFVSGIAVPGECQISFPDIDGREWHPV
jgi:hypothetical protein